MTLPFAAIAAELAREAQSRAATYPGMIAKGNLTRHEADYQIALISAMQQDCARFAQFETIGAAQVAPASHGFTWHERRAALMRELDYRRRLYPGWIAKGNMTQAEADTRCSRLLAMLYHYDLGYDWQAANGIAPNFNAALPSAEECASRSEFNTTFGLLIAQYYPGTDVSPMTGKMQQAEYQEGLAL